MSPSSFEWIADTLNVTASAAHKLRLLWVDGYSSGSVAAELGCSRPSVSMCSGRTLRAAERRAEKARKAEAQAAELKQQAAALFCAERDGIATVEDRERVKALAEAMTLELALLALEAPLWRYHFLDEPPPDHEANPGALPPPLTQRQHARALLRSMRGPRKNCLQTPEYDANGRRVGAPATLVTAWEAEQLCKQVANRAALGVQ